MEALPPFETFADLNHQPHISLKQNGSVETYAIGSQPFRLKLEHSYYQKHRQIVRASVLDQWLGVLGGRALFSGGALQDVHVRLGQDADGNVYWDLGDPGWKLLKISPDGWSVVTECPVKFRRPAGYLELPVPVAGGSVDELRPFLNVADDDQFRLIVGWLVASLNPHGPYPILELTGQQGTAKSTAARFLRLLIDPNASPARSMISNERDLAIAADNGWMLAFDNVSKLSDAMSDALCRMSTGGAFSARKLYSDSEEKLFQYKRPVILNGITDLATRPDLLERVVSVELQRISSRARKPELELEQAFFLARPKILGALATAVSAALGNRNSLPVLEWPRLADASKWVTGAEPALGWAMGTFNQLLHESKGRSGERVLEENEPLVKALRALAEVGWTGTASELLSALDPECIVRLPKGPNGLSGTLRRLSPVLADYGLVVDFRRTGSGGTRLIELSVKVYAKAA
ncbi:MAG: hypothetical protein Q8T13_21435 [Acidobacteriota bacterium]|nr:hypothetical protein [Acidobacteriota bacterium]